MLYEQKPMKKIKQCTESVQKLHMLSEQKLQCYVYRIPTVTKANPRGTSA